MRPPREIRMLKFAMWKDILTQPWLHNTVGDWLGALLVALVAFLVLLGLRRLLASQIGRLVKRTEVAWDDAIAKLVERTHAAGLLVAAALAGSALLKLPVAWWSVRAHLIVVVLAVQGALWTVCLIRHFAELYRKRKAREDPAGLTTVNAVALLLKCAVWIIALLLVLANLGVEVGPLLAGFGIGGIAVALAVQTVLKDLLASLSIILDKPFVMGDFLVLGEYMGSVEHIGIKTTRLRSLSGEQLVLSNSDLLESRIRNYGRMRERRVAFTLGVTYETARDRLVLVPDLIREAVEAQELTRFDRSHFKAYGDFALLFETVYYVAVPDFNKYMDIQQAINLRIHESFEQAGIEFAYPTQTLFVVPRDGSAPARKRPS